MQLLRSLIIGLAVAPTFSLVMLSYPAAAMADPCSLFSPTE